MRKIEHQNHRMPLGNSEMMNTTRLKTMDDVSDARRVPTDSEVSTTAPSSSNTTIIANSPSPVSGLQQAPHLTSSTDKMINFLDKTAAIKTGPKTKAIKFPVKLLYVLECGEYDDIITWAPNGLSFVITDTKQFEDMVLPEVFKEAKFASFQRKLYRWAFTKHPRTEQSTYSHPNFQRGNFPLCMTMTCIKRAKGQQVQSSGVGPMNFQGQLMERMMAANGMSGLGSAMSSMPSHLYDQQPSSLLLNSLSVPQHPIQMMPVQQGLPTPSYQDVRSSYDSVNPYSTQGLPLDPSTASAAMSMYYNNNNSAGDTSAGMSGNLNGINDEQMMQQMRYRSMIQGLGRNQFSSDLSMAEQVQQQVSHQRLRQQVQREQQEHDQNQFNMAMVQHMQRQRQAQAAQVHHVQGDQIGLVTSGGPNQSSLHDAARIMRDFNEQTKDS